MSPADKQPEQQPQQAAPAVQELQRASSKREHQAVDGTEVQGREQALRRDKPPSFKVRGDGGLSGRSRRVPGRHHPAAAAARRRPRRRRKL